MTRVGRQQTFLPTWTLLANASNNSYRLKDPDSTSWPSEWTYSYSTVSIQSCFQTPALDAAECNFMNPVLVQLHTTTRNALTCISEPISSSLRLVGEANSHNHRGFPRIATPVLRGVVQSVQVVHALAHLVGMVGGGHWAGRLVLWFAVRQHPGTWGQRSCVVAIVIRSKRSCWLGEWHWTRWLLKHILHRFDAL